MVMQVSPPTNVRGSTCLRRVALITATPGLATQNMGAIFDAASYLMISAGHEILRLMQGMMLQLLILQVQYMYLQKLTLRDDLCRAS